MGKRFVIKIEFETLSGLLLLNQAPLPPALSGHHFDLGCFLPHGVELRRLRELKHARSKSISSFGHGSGNTSGGVMTAGRGVELGLGVNRGSPRRSSQQVG